MSRHAGWLALLLGLALAMPARAFAPAVPGEYAQAVKAAGASARQRLPTEFPGPALRLGPANAVEVARLRAQDPRAAFKSLQVGIARDLAAAVGEAPTPEQLRFARVEDGHAARFTVTLAGAAAVRVAMDLSRLPSQAELLFSGSGDGDRRIGPIAVSSIADRGSPWWSPATQGETQAVEIFLAGTAAPRGAGVGLGEASHLIAWPGAGFEKAFEKIGQAGACQIDANCLASPSAAYVAASRSVARMLFVIGGASFFCTGTLLNDTDTATQVPWFYTANHCFDTASPPRTPAQMQAIAGTLNTFWFYESASCGVTTLSPSLVQRAGGASHVFNSFSLDVLLLRLNDIAPPGAYFSGWDPAIVATGDEVIDLHHPQGDLKKFSQGKVLGLGSYSSTYQPGGFIRVRWDRGTTEPGSSGSGARTFNGWEYLLRGGLLGGDASCTVPAGEDFFSRLDLAYPSLAPYLSPSATPLANVTDIWFNAMEPGWGLNLVQHASNVLFGVWYTYGADGRRQWFVMPGGSWISANTFVGTLYTTSGPAYTGAFDPSQVRATVVGTGTLQFSSPSLGTWSYTVNGVAGSRPIQRQPF